MPQSTPHKLKLSSYLREKFEQVILDEVKEAVRGASDRDSFYLECYEMIRGTTPVQTSARWNDACNLQYQLVRKLKMILMAQMIGAVKRNPKVACESQEVENEQAAQSQEAFLSSKDQQIGWTKALVTAADFCTTYPLGILSTTWEERVRYRRDSQWIDKRTNAVLPEEAIDEDASDDTYEELQGRTPEYLYRGVKTRNIHPVDFFLFPPNARSLDECDAAYARGCGERVEMSEGDLLCGIEDYGFVPDKTWDLIDHGPCRLFETSSSLRREADETRGVKEAERRDDKYYECFEWYTKVPHIYDEDGELLTPRYMLHDDLLVTLCPAADIVLRMEYNPESFRPYDPVYMLECEDEFYGLGMPELFYTEQTESNATIRQFIDSMNFSLNPVILSTKATDELNETVETFPGAWWLVKEQGDIQALQMPPLSHDPFLVLSTIEQDAKEQVVGNATYGRQTKVQKATQIQQEQQQTSTMVSFYLYFYLQAVERTAAKIIALYAAHEDDDVEFLDEFNHKRQITPSQLRGKYTYRATASDLTADPISRLNLANQRKQLTIDYITASLGLKQQGAFDELKRLWHAFREALIDMMTHDPEVYIGEEPDVAALTEQFQQALQQRAQQQAQLGPQGQQNGQGRNGNGHQGQSQPAFAQLAGVAE